MLYSFDSDGIIQHDVEAGREHRLPETPKLKSDFVQVEFVQPPGTTDSKQAEQLLLHAIASEAIALFDNPQAT